MSYKRRLVENHETGTTKRRKRSIDRKKSRLPCGVFGAALSLHAMQTRQATIRIVREQVFNIPELLEEILLHLPGDEILQLDRVSKYWRSVITGSTRIKRKLFLSPAPLTPVWVLDRYSRTLLPYDKNHFQQDSFNNKGSEEFAKRYGRSRPSAFNPMLFRKGPVDRRGSLLRRANLCESLLLAARPDLTRSIGSSVYHWMYVTQPPVNEVTFTIYYNVPKRDRHGKVYSDHSIRIEVKEPTGVRFGHLLHKFLEESSKVYHAWDAHHRKFPATSYKVKIRPIGAYGKRKSVVWALGAIFVSNEEYEGVMRKQKVGKPSPLAMEMMNKDNFGVEPERFYQWWSEEDQDWAVHDELVKRKEEGTKRVELLAK